MGNGTKKNTAKIRNTSAQTELLKVIAEQNHEKMLEYDVESDAIIVYNVMNGQYVEEKYIENYTKGDLFGRNFISEEDRDSYKKTFLECLKKPSHLIVDLRCSLEGNEPKWHRLYLVSVSNENGAVSKIAGRFVSVHKDKMVEEEMRRRAEMDALTGVYNHKTFEEICGRAIPACDTNAIFLMLDVDDFKMINDTQGHNMGDMVLAQTGAILNRMAQKRGYAGRLGGDEFAAFVWGFTDMEDIRAFCDALYSELKTIVFDMEYSASIGVSVKNERNLLFEDMYYEADQAVYAAKKGGKNQFVFFDDIKDLPVQAEAQKEVHMPSPMDETDEKALFETYRECMGYMMNADFRNGLQKVQKCLNLFFDADCTALVSWGGESQSVEEVHRESAEVMAKLVIVGVENAGEADDMHLMDEYGEICLLNVKELKEDSEKLYERLARARIWSIFGQELRMHMESEGVLLVINPRKHIAERSLLRLLSDYLVSRMKLQRVLEIREYETTHDHLTGLWNRNSFILWGERWKEAEYTSMGIVTTDIVGLSMLNKAYGYINGSKKLVAVAKLLGTVFEGYRVFRFDEDEMLVFCPNVAKNDFQFMVSCLKEKAEELEFGLAIGYSWASHVNVSEQIVESEVVMDNDKLRIIHGTQVRERTEKYLIEEVEQSIAKGNYPVYLQPKVNIHTNEVVGAEALVRLKDEDLGIVSPGLFIPVLERYNLIDRIDLHVLEQVFIYQKEAIAFGRKIIPISTNFSKLTIIQPEIINRIRALVDQYDIPRELISIEVTETVGDMDHVVIDKVVGDLITMGFKISMDDFGTHYSNLAVLTRYDFDSAKIDRSMIQDIETNPKNRTVLNYMTGLINDLGIDCVVEGIETKAQADIIRQTKCDVIQGFYYGKPVPMEEFYNLFMEPKEEE